MKFIMLVPSKGSVSIGHRDFFGKFLLRCAEAGHRVQIVDETSPGFLNQSRNVLLYWLSVSDADWGLWMDSDVYLDPTRILHMAATREEELITWAYPVRWDWDLDQPPEACLAWATRERNRPGGAKRWTVFYQTRGNEISRTPDGQLVELIQCGFGAVLMRPSVARKLAEKLGDTKIDWGRRRFIPAFDLIDMNPRRAGEDISFCRRWRGLCGGQIWCDPQPYVTNGQCGGCYADVLEKQMREMKQWQSQVPYFLSL